MDTATSPSAWTDPKLQPGCSASAILGAVGSIWSPLEKPPGVLHLAIGQGGEQQANEGAVGILPPLISCLLTPFPAPAALTGILSPHLSCKTTSKPGVSLLAALQSWLQPAAGGRALHSKNFFPRSAHLHGAGNLPNAHKHCMERAVEQPSHCLACARSQLCLPKRLGGEGNIAPRSAEQEGPEFQ